MTHLDNRISRCESNSSTSKEGRGKKQAKQRLRKRKLTRP